VLESRLSPRLDIEVMNAGRSGLGTAAEYLVLKHFALPRDPDLVILSFFMNDTVEDPTAFEWDEHGLPVRMRGRRLLVQNFVRDRLARLPFMRAEKFNERGAKGPLLVDPFLTLRHQDGPLVDPIWQRTLRVIEGAARLSEAASTDFLLLVTPIEDQLGGREPSAVAKTWKLTPEDLTPHPQERLVRFGRERGVDVFDLTPALARIEGELYYPRDGHWNPAGHRATASIIAEHLISSGWIAQQRGAAQDCRPSAIQAGVGSPAPLPSSWDGSPASEDLSAPPAG
jgi:hypothetical protein